MGVGLVDGVDGPSGAPQEVPPFWLLISRRRSIRERAAQRGVDVGHVLWCPVESSEKVLSFFFRS